MRDLSEDVSSDDTEAILVNARFDERIGIRLMEVAVENVTLKDAIYNAIINAIANDDGKHQSNFTHLVANIRDLPVESQVGTGKVERYKKMKFQFHNTWFSSVPTSSHDPLKAEFTAVQHVLDKVSSSVDDYEDKSKEAKKMILLDICKYNVCTP